MRMGSGIPPQVPRVRAEGSASWTCDICGSSLKNRMKLFQHVLAHMNRQQGLLVPCLECGKTFNNKHAMRNHIRNTHGASSHPQPCPHCLKIFKNRGSLQSHITNQHFIKNKNIKHICKLCGKNCETKYLVKKHLYRVHKHKE